MVDSTVFLLLLFFYKDEKQGNNFLYSLLSLSFCYLSVFLMFSPSLSSCVESHMHIVFIQRITIAIAVVVFHSALFL